MAKEKKVAANKIPTVGTPKNPEAAERQLERMLKAREINMEQVLYWIELQATAEEIAGSFRISVDTLDRRLREHYGLSFAELKKRCDGAERLNLRRNQAKLAETNAAMAIWLGKIWLNQRDDLEVEKLSAETLRNFTSIIDQLDKLRSAPPKKEPS